jgi:Amidohydrolase
MYGTRGRQILCHDDLAPGYAAALAHAYNKWAADYCKADPRRLKFAAQIAMHDVKSAVEEARRCVRELGAVAVIGTPNPVNGHRARRAGPRPWCATGPSRGWRSRGCWGVSAEDIRVRDRGG